MLKNEYTSAQKRIYKCSKTNMQVTKNESAPNKKSASPNPQFVSELLSAQIQLLLCEATEKEGIGGAWFRTIIFTALNHTFGHIIFARCALRNADSATPTAPPNPNKHFPNHSTNTRPEHPQSPRTQRFESLLEQFGRSTDPLERFAGSN